MKGGDSLGAVKLSERYGFRAADLAVGIALDTKKGQ